MYRTGPIRLIHSTSALKKYMSPKLPKQYGLNTLLFPTSIPFAGADNVWSASNVVDTTLSSKNHLFSLKTNLSFAHPESDWTAQQLVWTHTSDNKVVSSSNHSHISFATAESDFCANYNGEIITANRSEIKQNIANPSVVHLSFATPYADFTGIYPDEPVSAYKSISEALAPSNEARVLTSANDNLQIQHVNEAWTRLCGYTNKEINGKTLSLIQGDDTNKKVTKEIITMLKQGKSTEAVLINYDNRGRKFRNFLTASPVVSNETGEITHFLGVLRDLGTVTNNEHINTQTIVT